MNTEHVVATIEMVQAQVRDLERDLTEKKKMANSLCKMVGRDPIYANVEASHVGTVLRSDEFYGKPLTSVVRTILERRGAAELGAASTDAIYLDMIRGGYQFDAKSEMTAKRSLAISLAKNSYLFHRLPNDDWGLVNWYPNIPTKTKVNGNKDVKDAKDAKADAEPEKDGLAEPYPNEFADETETASQDAQEEVAIPTVEQTAPAKKRPAKGAFGKEAEKEADMPVR